MSESVPLTDVVVLEKALRMAGVEVGSVGGEAFRRVVAERMLAQPGLNCLLDRARAEWVERVLAGEGFDSWTPYDTRDIGEAFLVESVRDLVAALRAPYAAPETTQGEGTP